MTTSDFKVTRLGEPTIDSPLIDVNFVNDDATVVYGKEVDRIIAEYERDNSILAFERAGPRRKIFHDHAWSKAAILTAGGLCPGLNDVIKGLTMTLKLHYRVPVVYGIRFGYQGLNPEYEREPLILDEDFVDDIHEDGGTILGSSRGKQDPEVMVDTLSRMNINLLFCIGGDGTLRGAHAIQEEARRRGLEISVVCIPKTIDNDINFIDKSFGFETAIYATNSVITAAHNESKGAPNCVGLIHVMGRDSGFIAAYASLANTHVNYCLIPEEEFNLEKGPRAFMPELLKRLKKRHHAVVIVSEGAGQNLIHVKKRAKDKSGNVLHEDIGMFLKSEMKKAAAKRDMDINVKYFDPSYMIRSLSAHGTDAVFCLLLAQNAVHAAMAGCTDMVIGHWNDRFTHVPISLATSARKKIDLNGPIWQSVKSVTWPKY